jgi:hypothetical protein
MNNVRLEKSLRLLRDVNAAREIGSTGLIQKAEAALRQHDYDARDRVDARQLTIYETVK